MKRDELKCSGRRAPGTPAQTRELTPHTPHLWITLLYVSTKSNNKDGVGVGWGTGTDHIFENFKRTNTTTRVLDSAVYLKCMNFFFIINGEPPPWLTLNKMGEDMDRVLSRC